MSTKPTARRGLLLAHGRRSGEIPLTILFTRVMS